MAAVWLSSNWGAWVVRRRIASFLGLTILVAWPDLILDRYFKRKIIVKVRDRLLLYTDRGML